MESYVEACKQRPRTTDSGTDGFEGPLRVPTSVLHECHESFKAADEKRQKASTQLFADTGLMALLCRHDRVLWLANMTSAGEKQYYVLALLKQLFDNLPRSLTVGVLYDIGCQLHLSFIKWNFLPQYSFRLVFALAVFHAYGHQWPCQLIYHPRFTTGFGLSDGEGCERFWNSIKKLIPTLRVSGVGSFSGFSFVPDRVGQFHQRLFVLDSQVYHLSAVSLEHLGDWLCRKWHNCKARKETTEAELATLDVPEHVIRMQWQEQVKAQTRPSPRALLCHVPSRLLLNVQTLSRTLARCRKACSREYSTP
jgi:hypothetical protein